MAKLKHTSREVMPNLLNGELRALLESKGITLVYQDDEPADRPFRTVEEYIKATSKTKSNDNKKQETNTTGVYSDER